MNHIISHSDSSEQVLFSRIERFFSDIGLAKLLLKCNFYKASDFSCVILPFDSFSWKQLSLDKRYNGQLREESDTISEMEIL